jgi:hypothetical protein
MSMFDGILGNLGGLQAVADKLGLQPEQMQALMSDISSKISGGTTDVSALASTAAEHGVSADKLQELLGSAGGGGIMGTLTGMLDKDGDGNPLNDLTGLAKGLFG